jgi:hypothetical protein
MSYTVDGNPNHGICCATPDADCTGFFSTSPATPLIIPLDAVPGVRRIDGSGADRGSSKHAYTRFKVE